jgi:hypothetical protein
MASKKAAVAAKGKEIVSREKGGAALTTNTGMQRGFEGGIDQEDLVIPRAAVMQSTSDELKDKQLVKEKGIVFGDIVNSLTKDKLGEEFIPIFMFKNWARFNPRDEKDPNFVQGIAPAGTVWVSRDPLDPRVVSESKFGPNGEKPAATTFINFFSFFPGSPMPVIVSFAKTSYGAGKKLITLARLTGGDLFSKKYRLTTETESNEKGTYAVLKIQPSGNVTPEEYKHCEELWNKFSQKAKDIQVHDQAKSEDTGDATGERPY